jgi:uncharacterized damage-inducible protein DinB
MTNVESPSEPPPRRFGWSDMFVAPEDDPRTDGGFANDERSMLLGYLADRRLTFEMKCADLDTAAMAARSVPPSDMSLLGLLRHLTDVERHWFRQEIAGSDEPDHYGDDDFDGAVSDALVVADAWEAWREEVAFSDKVVAESPDLGARGKKRGVPLREVLVHMIEEYARHNGHADLLRERIDGRVGQ